MPRCFTTPEERREYFNAWWKTEKGHALRKKVILKRAIQAQRLPSPAMRKKYDVTSQELAAVWEAIQLTP